MDPENGTQVVKLGGRPPSLPAEKQGLFISPKSSLAEP